MKHIYYWGITIWLYIKFMAWLKVAVFPWLYKVTYIFGMIWPKGHNFLYTAPFRNSGNLLVDVVMYILSPILIFILLYIIFLFYVGLYLASKEEIIDGNAIGFVGHFAMFCMVFALQLFFLWQGPTLVYS